MKIVALLPARLLSTRIKTKCLKKINGIPIIIHTLSRVKLVKGIDDFFVCTDSNKIKKLGWKKKLNLNKGLFLTMKWYLENTQWIQKINKKKYSNRLGLKL